MLKFGEVVGYEVVLSCLPTALNISVDCVLFRLRP